MADSTIKKLKQIPYDKARAMLDKAENAKRETNIEHVILINKEWAILSERLADEFEENKLKFISNPNGATRYFTFASNVQKALLKDRTDVYSTRSLRYCRGT